MPTTATAAGLNLPANGGLLGGAVAVPVLLGALGPVVDPVLGLVQPVLSPIVSAGIPLVMGGLVPAPVGALLNTTLSALPVLLPPLPGLE